MASGCRLFPTRRRSMTHQARSLAPSTCWSTSRTASAPKNTRSGSPRSSSLSDDAILTKDLDGVITSWNRGAERLFGYTATEAIGKPITTILIPSDRLDEEREILGRIRRGEHVDHYETIRQCKDGSLLDISLTVSPLKDAEGKIVGASKIARDITELRRAQERQKLLIGEIQHRIKNTLATVQAIATQTLRSSPKNVTPSLPDSMLLPAAHDLLRDDNWHQAALGDLVGKALNAFPRQTPRTLFCRRPRWNFS